MVPARNLLRRHYDTYGGGFEDFLQEEKIYSTHNPSSSSSSSSSSSLMIPSPSPMAGEEEQETSISSSKNSKGAAADYDCAWLQLGVGSSSTTTTSANTLSQVNLDLDLFSNKSPQLPATSLQQPPVPTFPSQYGFGSYRGPWGSYWWSNAPSSTLPLPPPQQPPLQYCTNYFPQYVGSSPPPTTTRSELTVIKPPTTRRQAGVWFLLQAAENQGREPLLPQISKSYLRIKDGRMTVRLLMKYLVKKLRLHDESEVEISCGGQVLLPYLTLQHVRDNIWCLREAAAFLSDSPTDHVMTLQYGRSSSC